MVQFKLMQFIRIYEIIDIRKQEKIENNFANKCASSFA